MSASVPTIFDDRRRTARLARALARRGGGDAATWLVDAMAADVAERLGFVRFAGTTALVSGLGGDAVAEAMDAPHRSVARIPGLALEAPLSGGPYDLIVSLGELDTVNDLPGALLHLRHALDPGGLLLATMLGAGSLPALRAAMLAADGDRPAARIHPQIDSRAASALLQRAGFARQVVDQYALTARYASFDRLAADLRDQGLTSALADRPPPLGRRALGRAKWAFFTHAERDGKTSENFQILTITAWNNYVKLA